MKQVATLADAVYRETFKTPQILTPLLRKSLQQARKFVLDDDMSTFLGDLGYAALQLPTSEKRIQRLEQLRTLARLPFPITWIEWQLLPLARRVKEAYGSPLDERLIPQREGFLLLQHATIESAVMAFLFTEGTTNFGGEGRMTVGATPFAFAWNTEDGPIPFNVIENIHPTSYASEWLLSCPDYKTKQIQVVRGYDYVFGMDHDDNFLANKMDETIGILKYIITLLATINDLPLAHREVVADKGFFAKGRYRKFLDHRTITLKVPATRYAALARQVVGHLKRRAHEVRGHWRKDFRNQGERIWIHSHMRGDAALGIVTHDYNVEH